MPWGMIDSENECIFHYSYNAGVHAFGKPMAGRRDFLFCELFLYRLLPGSHGTDVKTMQMNATSLTQKWTQEAAVTNEENFPKKMWVTLRNVLTNCDGDACRVAITILS